MNMKKHIKDVRVVLWILFYILLGTAGLQLAFQLIENTTEEGYEVSNLSIGICVSIVLSTLIAIILILMCLGITSNLLRRNQENHVKARLKES